MKFKFAKINILLPETAVLIVPIDSGLNFGQQGFILNKGGLELHPMQCNNLPDFQVTDIIFSYILPGLISP